MLKHRASSLINIGGLSVGLATGILILLVVLEEFKYDRFHKNLSEIYVLGKNQQLSDGVSTGHNTAGPMAATLRSEFAETKYAARVAYFGDEVIRIKDQVLTGSGIYTEPDLFNMMSFPALQGDAHAALASGSQAVVTESAARKLFGKEPAMGQVITMGKQHFQVGAVVKDIPSASTIRFEMVLPFSYFEQNNDWLKKWDDNRIMTWVQVKPGVKIAPMNERLTSILQTRSNDKTVSLFLYPMERMHLYNGFENGKPSGGKISVMRLLIALAAFVIMIACINFMNIATARSEQRSREVGVRKTLGATRGKIILQFIGEALLMSFVSLAVAVILVQLASPSVGQLMGKKIQFDFGDLRLWGMLGSVGLFTGLVAGSYPAFFMSAFKPVKVLKGGFITRKGGGLRKALVTFQFVLSVILIVSTIVIYRQIDYIRSRPLGYEQKNLLDIHANGDLGGKFTLFKTQLKEIPGVLSVTAGDDNVIGFGGGITGMDYPGRVAGQEISVMVSHVSYDWARTLRLPMVEGRDFSPEFATDSNACIINESAVRKMKLANPIGSIVGGSKVIGVFKDFVYNNPSGIIAPLLINFRKENFGHFIVRIDAGSKPDKTIAGIKAVAHGLNPDYPFDYDLMKDVYSERFEDWDSITYATSIFSSMAIFIACLGLFGLASFVAERRGKEISIRKVFGAGSGKIWAMLARDFLMPVFIALLIVIPVSIWAAHTILANITYHTPLSWWMFGLATLITLGIAVATTGVQAARAATRNPIDKLRTE